MLKEYHVLLPYLIRAENIEQANMLLPFELNNAMRNPYYFDIYPKPFSDGYFEGHLQLRKKLPIIIKLIDEAKYNEAKYSIQELMEIIDNGDK